MDAGDTAPRVARIRRVPRARRWIVETEDGAEFSIPVKIAEAEAVTEGDPLSPRALRHADPAKEESAAHEAALRLLEYRARSRQEMARRLGMKGFTGATVDRVLARLERVDLLDDAAFARAWVADKSRSSPKGRAMLRYQLAGQGIAAETADQALADIDEEALALSLARRRARSAPGDSYERFAANVGPYLQRRGFPFAVAEAATRAAWKERDT